MFSEPYRFGGGMRYNVRNLSNKPPSRTNSKQVRKRSAVRRLDSASRIKRGNGTNIGYNSFKQRTNDQKVAKRLPGSSSLARTSGKRGSRIIISDKTDKYKEKPKEISSTYKKNELPQNLMRDIKPVDSLKSSINQMFNSSIKKPAGLPINPSSSLYSNPTKNSNFSSKIRVQRDSTEESTRDETKIMKSSMYSKPEDNSKKYFFFFFFSFQNI